MDNIWLENTRKKNLKSVSFIEWHVQIRIELFAIYI